MDDENRRNSDNELDTAELEELSRILYPERQHIPSAEESVPGVSAPEEGQEREDSGKMEKRSPEVSGFGKELFGWVQAVVTSLVTVLLVFVFLVRVFGVSGSSMFPTLHNGDYVFLINKTITSFKAGDVIVFVQDSYSDSPLVKRLIATEGQTVDINFDSGEVFVAGVFSNYVDVETNKSYDVEFPIVVEEGKFFVMGDNRNESVDSRYSLIGQIDENVVLGKVAFVLFPFNRFGEKP